MYSLKLLKENETWEFKNEYELHSFMANDIGCICQCDRSAFDYGPYSICIDLMLEDDSNLKLI